MIDWLIIVFYLGGYFMIGAGIGWLCMRAYYAYKGRFR